MPNNDLVFCKNYAMCEAQGPQMIAVDIHGIYGMMCHGEGTPLGVYRLIGTR